MESGFSWQSPSARLVMEAVLEILTEVGYEGLTAEDVKGRAGPAGQALGDYPDLDVLVSAALSHVALLVPPEPTGCLREDLHALLRPWRSPRTGDEMVLGAVLSPAERRPLLKEAVHRALDRPVTQAIASLLSAHMTDVAQAEHIQTLAWILRGLVLERLRTGARAAVDLDRLVDFLVAGLGGASRNPHAPGIPR